MEMASSGCIVVVVVVCRVAMESWTEKKVSLDPHCQFHSPVGLERAPVHTRGVRVTGRGLCEVTDSEHRTRTSIR
jgi:hypothetical protein